MAQPDGDLVLCCFLWAKEGQQAALAEYEDRVLAYVPDHGGEVLQRVQADGADGRPHEVQLYRFSDQAAVDDYLADPRRLALNDVRDVVVERTELFPVQVR